MVIHFLARFDPNSTLLMVDDPEALGTEMTSVAVNRVHEYLLAEDKVYGPEIFSEIESVVTQVILERFDFPHCNIRCGFASSTLMVIDVTPKETVQAGDSRILH